MASSSSIHSRLALIALLSATTFYCIHKYRRLKRLKTLSSKLNPSAATIRGKIFFISQTGTSKALAQRLRDLLASNGVAFDLVDPRSYEPEDLPKETVAIFVASTWEGGKPPKDGEFLVEWLSESAEDFRVGSLILSGCRFAVFGVGSRAYGEAYNAVGKELASESRSFMTDTQYPMQMEHETQEQDEFKPHDEHNYPSPPPPMSENPYTTQPMTETPDHPSLELPELPKDEEEVPSPGRSKPVPKPDREITKDANGRFYCTWPGCTEEVKDFNRKCEWSKHMDKHDRPYRCKEPGCEKLPGFTYSGGLLRHEREVHGKHGGPKKQLNCPHPNCKRHTGKGFSRQENLNEHLRRVHTADTGMTQISQMAMDETEEDASQAIITGMKRKRGNSKGDLSELESLREEIKKMKAENDELKRQSQAQQAQTAEVMRQLVELQNLATLQHPRMNAPQATM